MALKRMLSWSGLGRESSSFTAKNIKLKAQKPIYVDPLARLRERFLWRHLKELDVDSYPHVLARYDREKRSLFV